MSTSKTSLSPPGATSESSPAPATESAPAALTVPVPAINAAPLDTAETSPAAGGSYLRDPATGALTLVTPSTQQD